jgi:hypothetical protein
VRGPSVVGEIPGCRHTVEPRHPDVHHDDVRAEARGQFDRLKSVGGLTDHVDVRLGRQ